MNEKKGMLPRTEQTDKQRHPGSWCFLAVRPALVYFGSCLHHQYGWRNGSENKWIDQGGEAVWFQLPKENPAVPVVEMYWVPSCWSGLPVLTLNIEGCFQSSWAGRSSGSSGSGAKFGHISHLFARDSAVWTRRRGSAKGHLESFLGGAFLWQMGQRSKMDYWTCLAPQGAPTELAGKGMSLSTWPLVLTEPNPSFLKGSLGAAKDCDWKLHTLEGSGAPTRSLPPCSISQSSHR